MVSVIKLPVLLMRVFFLTEHFSLDLNFSNFKVMKWVCVKKSIRFVILKHSYLHSVVSGQNS
jgi:hypothetical protein